MTQDWLVSTRSDRGGGFRPDPERSSPSLPAQVAAEFAALEPLYPQLAVGGSPDAEGIAVVTYRYSPRLGSWVVVVQGSAGEYGPAGALQLAFLADGATLLDCMTGSLPVVRRDGWLMPGEAARPRVTLKAPGPEVERAVGGMLALDSANRVLLLPGGQAEVDQLSHEILAVSIPPEIRRRIEFFASQFEFLEPAAEQLEYKTKDTARLSGVDLRAVMAMDTGKDKVKDLGTQTRNGLSVRALMTLLVYTKAIAYFRGNKQATLDDLRQILPFVLHDKLAPDPDSPFFDAPGNAVYRTDRIGWLRKLFDLSCGEYDRLNLDRDDPLAALEAEFGLGLEGVPEAEVRNRIIKIERLLAEWSKSKKMYGHIYDDLLKLKYLHQRYSNYLRWLTNK